MSSLFSNSSHGFCSNVYKKMCRYLKQRYLSYFLCIISIATGICQLISREERLNAVHGHGVETLYINLLSTIKGGTIYLAESSSKPELFCFLVSHREAGEIVDDDVDPYSKMLLCHYISTSGYFQMWNRSPVYINEIYYELQRENLTVYKELYSEFDTNASSSSHTFQYSNPMQKIKVFIKTTGETITENAFVCLCSVKGAKKGALVKFYVSEEYDMKKAPSASSKVAGRFVFMYNEYNELEIKALAEEPAKGLIMMNLTSSIERLYLQRRKIYKPAENELDDPLCKLTTDQRVRVCTLVFNSAHFDGELTFLPNSSNVDDVFCLKKTISFRTEESRIATNQQPYEEWMIRCLTKEYFFTYKSEFFLSQAYSSNEIFAYRWANEKEIFIENLFTDIRF